MGCGNDKPNIRYNYLADQNQVSNGSGPFVFSTYDEFLKNQEKYKNQTMIENLNNTFKKYSSNNCFGYRKSINENDFEEKYTYLTYGEISEYAYNFARNVKDLGLATKKSYSFEGEHKIMGIFSRNCAEWLITDIGLQRDSTTSVTFYNTLGDKSFDHIFEQTNVATVCVSNDGIKNLIKYYKEFKFESLKNVILYDLTLYSNESMFKQLEETGLKIYSFKSLIENKNSKAELEISKPNSLLTLCYTSGTTSLPKGVKITQNMMFCDSDCIEDSGLFLNTDDTHLSYLPLAHIMERLIILTMMYKGGLSCFIASGDVKKYLATDISFSRPTILVTVPRVLTLFHQVITGEFAKLTGCKKTMVDRGIKAKTANYIESGQLTHSFYDNLVFNKIRNKFGGRVKVFITGSAPLPLEVARDMKIFFSCPILEGYGMTETCGATTVSHMQDPFNTGHGVIKNCEIKLADRIEMKYHSKTELDGELSPTGEICVRGLTITKGYFLEKEKTEELFDSEGWLKTGDVGRILPGNKALKVIDRVKEIFKLSQGEYIAPSKLESVYVKNSLTLQLCVYGDSFKSSLICIVCPNKVTVAKFLMEKGIMKENDDVTEFYNRKELQDEFKTIFDALAKEANFNPLEKPTKFIFSKTDFSVDNELVTPTMKLCRNKIAEFFKDEIKAAYNEK